ncbi:hypothetical protein PIB30_052647 [Stylosanthes scabra]|uniref:Uncharacterized protein n=1 Tax=Stylosanthes scabra TaxID=79078 RepID=A0ABU6XJU2_9FABA|nr:hypothetical protein [Stylosanthes scabra]
MNRGRREQRKSKTSSVMGTEPPRDLLPAKHDFPKLLLVLAISSLIAFSCNLFFTSFVNPPTQPFCDSNLIDSLPSFSVILSLSLYNCIGFTVNIVPFSLRCVLISFSWQSLLTDDCEPCPPHGECYAGVLECFKGYRRHRNLCVEESEISESARKIVERVEFHVCEEYVQFMCYETGSIWLNLCWFQIPFYIPVQVSTPDSLCGSTAIRSWFYSCCRLLGHVKLVLDFLNILYCRSMRDLGFGFDWLLFVMEILEPLESDRLNESPKSRCNMKRRTKFNLSFWSTTSQSNNQSCVIIDEGSLDVAMDEGDQGEVVDGQGLSPNAKLAQEPLMYTFHEVIDIEFDNPEVAIQVAHEVLWQESM